MTGTTLIVPGFHGSGPGHWQTWLEAELRNSRRVAGIGWDEPVLADWAVAVECEIQRAAEPVWLVAHSFGCLATIAAVARLADRASARVAGALLVAPADPDRFSSAGLRPEGSADCESIAVHLPQRPLGLPGLVIASRNDPWMPFWKTALWARRWRCGLADMGAAGHINVASGFGPWPHGLTLLHRLQREGSSGGSIHGPASGTWNHEGAKEFGNNALLPKSPSPRQ
ncbi:putative esterase of the alpha/beta hydrolase fold protein [Thioflavicoccus mobilis 8321]|uniref:Putative esterase of the alpha/beta hydrolase fold protein n=1 Tax=Thioflavicoccus mobilis 8321 TaxID=765912 RepID=L0GWS3_9GAMM|nr:alpha/beta hydrolase [Thioflavicoccus mobilis]AGA89754.1 putative esterase of the alpha/beta hydrolase fold protein [Thioflavicoccus mobilis 8321]